MERYIRLFLLNILMMFGLVSNAEAAEIASSFTFPVPSYSVTGYDFGDTVYSGVLHLGEDATAAALDPIYAAANGRIVPSPITGWHESYGYVVVIEHELPDGDIVYSVSGHMRSEGLMTSGDVSQGDVIGYAGYDDENGDGGPHLHFGIYYGPYSGSWVFYGRGSSTNNWYNPTDFITAHQIPTAAYNAITAKVNQIGEYYVGTPRDGNDPHWYNEHSSTFVVQDYDGGEWDWIAITYNEGDDRAYVIRHGFWTYYKSLENPTTELGVPYGDEMDVTRLDEFSNPYDNYCTATLGYSPEQCIDLFCGTTDVYTSMQRFANKTLCWNSHEARSCVPDEDCTCYADDAHTARYTSSGAADLDGDLYFENEDCDDTRSDVYPGAPELADLRDNNCDGVIDHEDTTWLDSDGITDDQYLFIDVNQDGYADPCVRQGYTLYCDQDMTGGHDWTFAYGNGGNEEYFSNGTGVTVNFGNDMWYSDTTSDGISESSCSYGDGATETQRLVHNGTIMVRWGTESYLDDDMDGITDRVITWGSTLEYYLADMDGDGTTDLVRRDGNIFYVNTNGDIYTDWWFVYGYADGSDRYYFADLDGDGKDDILVQRWLVDYNWFLVKYNQNIITGGTANPNDDDFTYGHGLLVTEPTEDQYLFFDANGDGYDDPCVRRYTTTILCDTDSVAGGDVSFDIGSSGGSAWYAGGSSVCVRYNDTFYCDQTADGGTANGVTDTVFAIGNGGTNDYQFGDDAAAVRYSGDTYVDSDQDGWTNFVITWGGTTGWPYYIADMDGDGTPDMIRQDGNIFYVNTNGDSYTDWWFTYGYADGSDDYYFADLDGDGAADIMVLRENENGIRNWLLVKYNSNIVTGGTSNPNDDDFTYGWGL